MVLETSKKNNKQFVFSRVTFGFTRVDAGNATFNN